MPTRLLVCARDMAGSGHDQYRKGDIASVRAAAAPWGGLEVPPDFVRIDVTDAEPADFDALNSKWYQNLDWDVLASDLAIDGHRLLLWTTNRRESDGRGDITLTQVTDFLEGWGAVNVIGQKRGNAAGVRFDITVFAAVTSAGFWDRRPAATVTFTELAYAQAGGVHDIRLTYPAGANHQVVVNEVAERATVLADDPALRQVTFQITRAEALAAFKASIKNVIESVMQRRQFYFSPASVDTVIAAGGSTSVTAAQVQDNLLDRAVE